MNLLKGVRPSDYLLAGVMAAGGAFLGYENATAGAGADVAHKLDSHSWLLVPVFVAAALPILWRRRHVLPAIGVSFAIVAASVPAFGWVTRCGFALPLSVALAYAVARFAGPRQAQVLGLVGILALQVVTLVEDASTGGLNALALSVPAAAVFYGIGLVVQKQVEKSLRDRAQTPTLEHVHA